MEGTRDLRLVRILSFVFLITATGAGWHSDVNSVTGSEFVCEDSDRTYQEAIKKCDDRDHQLASILSDDDNQFLGKFLEDHCKGDAWIGLNKISGTEEWVDGSPVGYKPGPVTFQNNDKCTMIKKDPSPSWQTLQCDAGDTKKVLCKRPGSTRTTAEPTSTTESTSTSTTESTSTSTTESTSTSEPATSTAAPATSTSAPATSTSEPVTSTSEPATSTSAPATSTSEPVTSTSAPATSTSAPATSTSAPVQSTPGAIPGPSDPRQIVDDLLRQEKGKNPCEDSTWAYSNLTGYCYMFKSHQKTWDEAVKECESMKGELLEIDDEVDQSFVDGYLMKYNYQDHWLGAKKIKKNPTKYRWFSKLTKPSFVQKSARWAENEPVKTCVYINRADRMAWKWFWKTADCDEKKSVYCRRNATRCPAVPLAKHVVPSSKRPNIELTITYQCEAGYYMPDYEALTQDWQEAKTDPNNTIPEPAYKVNPTMNITCDYDATKGARWTNTSLAVADCLPITCVPLPVIKFAVANITHDAAYKYPTYVKYTCQKGYYFMDENNRSTTGHCGPDYEWRRSIRAAFPKKCDPLPCESLKPPKKARMLNGMNTFFGMTVAFRCDFGYMFPDGAVWQFAKCGKRPDDKLLGWWNETTYPDCQELICPAPRRIQHASMSNTNRTWKNTILYNCTHGYEFPDSSTQVTVRCTDNAIWHPQIDDCAKIPKKIRVTGRRYQPEPVEAPQAASIGGTATIICCVMIGLVILLDLNSIVRDLKRMKRNLRHLGKRFTNPQLPQPRKMPDEVA